MSAWFWSTLGIAETRDTRAIRRAYAERLKALDVDADMDGFARLRQARDMALRLAAMPLAPLTDAEDDEGFFRDDFAGAERGHDAASAYAPLAGPAAEAELAPEQFPPRAEADPHDHPGWKLQAILFPDGQYCDAGLLREEYDAALVHLDALLDEARGAPLDMAGGIDHALAEMLAESWPRSAPLVERANEEFGWLGEAGRLSERPALVFLNARIAGMRFHQDVQQAGHPMHHAWVELARPGRPSFRDRNSNNRDTIFALITDLRENFPEVESYLDADRVAGWENGPAKGEQWAYVVKLLGLIYLVAAGALFMADVGGGGSDAAVPPPIALLADPVEEEYPLAVNAIFGGEDGEYDRALLAGDFASDLANGFRSGRTGSDGTFDAGVARARDIARNYLVLIRDDLDFDTLVEMQEIHRLWLRSLAEEGRLGADCPLLANEPGDLGAVPLDRAALDREAALLRRLVEQGRLAARPDGIMAGNASVPGWAIEEAIRHSGLSDRQLTAALTNPDSPDRCRATLGMLDAVLPRPGDVPIELLRIL